MARPKSQGETKSHQQHLLMTPSEVEAIDTWRFANRIGSRGEAIRRLCQMALFYDDRAEGMQAYADEIRQSPSDNQGRQRIVEVAIPMAGDIQMLDRVRLLFSDGEKPIVMENVEEVREKLKESRQRRTIALDKIDQGEKSE